MYAIGAGIMVVMVLALRPDGPHWWCAIDDSDCVCLAQNNKSSLFAVTAGNATKQIAYGPDDRDHSHWAAGRLALMGLADH